MANIPYGSTVEREYFCVVTYGHPDQYDGCYWSVYDRDGKIVSWGQVESTKGRGSALNAMAAARRSARYYWRKNARARVLQQTTDDVNQLVRGVDAIQAILAEGE